MTPILLLAAAVLAGPAPDGPPRFVARAAGGSAETTGRLEQLLPKWGAKLADPPATVPPDDLVSLVRADRPRPSLPGSPQLILANGDRISGTLSGGDDRAVAVTPMVGSAKADANWRVPLAQVRVLWLDSPPTATPADPARYPWLDPGRKKDVVLLRNGDVLSGDIERFAEDGKSLTWKPAGGKGPTTVDLTRTAAVAFNPTLVSARKPKGTFARLVTARGARLTVTAAEGDADRLRGTTAFGAKFDLPLADVIALDVVQGKSVALSGLTPKRAETVGYGDLTWPWTADRTVKGEPIRLLTARGEETFDKGLGTHPHTTLTYALGGKYRRFEATVGLDAATGRRGAAAVRILVDGKERSVPGLPQVTAAGGCVGVVVDVTGAKELTLVVDFGPAGDVEADVDWADARLVE